MFVSDLRSDFGPKIVCKEKPGPVDDALVVNCNLAELFDVSGNSFPLGFSFVVHVLILEGPCCFSRWEMWIQKARLQSSR